MRLQWEVNLLSTALQLASSIWGNADCTTVEWCRAGGQGQVLVSTMPRAQNRAAKVQLSRKTKHIANLCTHAPRLKIQTHLKKSLSHWSRVQQGLGWLLIKLVNNLLHTTPLKGTVSWDVWHPLKGQCPEMFETFFPWFQPIVHLGPLFVCWSIFAYGFDFAVIFACAKISTMSSTLLNQARLCHRHCRFKFSGVIDTMESKLTYFYNFLRFWSPII